MLYGLKKKFTKLSASSEEKTQLAAILETQKKISDSQHYTNRAAPGSCEV